ncbi:MAG: toprim domain-containing protein [Acidimicrobiia bacterium]|nr:toprim domain-containing protein [Acidimicrobiia bacterium]
MSRRGSRGGLIDWFSGRVMFPIRDLKGDAVGFGARILEGDGPKYLNTPETRLYKKAELLYGLDRAKADITRQGYAIVVEGYTDVIALHRAGLPIAVASCGTALGEDHFDLLRRFADRIVLAFDADQAGAGAAIRGDELHIPAELGLDLRVAKMPEGRDPADLVQDGDTSVLLSAVEDSVPLLQFRLEREVTGHRLDEPEGRARAVRAAATIVGRLTDPVARSEYARYISRLTGADGPAVAAAVETAARGGGSNRRSGPAAAEASSPPTELTFSPPRSGQDKAERDLLRLAVAGRLAGRTVEPALFGRPDHRHVFELIRTEAADGSVDLSGVEDEAVAGFLRTLVMDDSPEADLEELLARLELAALDRSMDEIGKRLEQTDPTDQSHSQLLSELIALERTRRRKQIE